MTLINFDLKNRNAAAFGLLASSAIPSVATITQEQSNYRLSSFDSIDSRFEDVRFSYNDVVINLASLPFTGQSNENILAPPPIIRFNASKSHIKTPVNDSDNIVIERWGTKPWEIRMRGLLIDVENRHFPANRIKKIRELFQYNGVVEVSGKQFFANDIASVFFEDIEINGVQGYQDTVQYALVLNSIKPVEFTLKNP